MYEVQMPDKEKVRLLWDQVRKETDIQQAVKMIADLGEQAVNERMAETSVLREQIKKLDDDMSADFKSLQKALYGNGDPSHSILARLERIEERLCKSASNADKALWIVISAILVQIVLYLLKIL